MAVPIVGHIGSLDVPLIQAREPLDSVILLRSVRFPVVSLFVVYDGRAGTASPGVVCALCSVTSGAGSETGFLNFNRHELSTGGARKHRHVGQGVLSVPIDDLTSEFGRSFCVAGSASAC